ncbi:unnamed protein product [Rotaria sp. Silwood2]|nr:unnamed protein product [Rotaria sp. Silwood2]CAF2510548.1 unnamed protein product [Rotaria sp. Silwood2]CAF3873948.1 unnamed protein product [Rotaria sp. Silwood2]CAF3921127.1 unnamed protein product [Rotaria sp. Silwood2]
MSFSWSTSSSPSFSGLKPTTTNSFADALKRLAEHVEEKNKNIDANNIGSSNLVQSSTDFPNRMIPFHVNNSMSPEQTLRLYTQYIHEAERREDMRRRYLRVYSGSNGPNINLPILNSIPIPENTDKKLSEQSSQLSKPKLKLFRPYDLDSPNSNSHQTSPSPSTYVPSNVTVPDELQPTVTSSGKEKQLFNTLGLVQQSTDIQIEKSSFVETAPLEDSTSIETVFMQQDNIPFNTKDSSLSVTLKRKSVFSSNTQNSSNRKQSKIDKIHNTVE